MTPSTRSASPNTTKRVAAPIRTTRSGRRGPELLADHDGEGVGGHHAQGRPQPGAEDALPGGERDGGEHGLVAQLGEQERAPDGGDRRHRALPTGRAAAVSSSSSRVSPRSVHAANPRNARPATIGDRVRGQGGRQRRLADRRPMRRG